MSDDNTVAPPILTTGPLCDRYGISRHIITRLISEGLPAFRIDATRWGFPVTEAEQWLRDHGYLKDPYRAVIKKLVDAAPPLTAEQAAQIRAVLGSAVVSK